MSVMTTLRAPACWQIGHRHATDRSRAGDENIFADQIERERGMDGVA